MELINEALKSELEKLGLGEVEDVRYNLDKAALVMLAVLDGEGILSDSGALIVNTSPFTGRSPNDKYLIDNGDPDLGMLLALNLSQRNNLTTCKKNYCAR